MTSTGWVDEEDSSDHLLTSWPNSKAGRDLFTEWIHSAFSTLPTLLNSDQEIKIHILKKKHTSALLGFFCCCCCFPKVWFSKPKRESPPGFRQPAQLESLSLWWAGKLPEEKNPSIPGENKRAWKYAMVATVPFLECLYFQWQGSREQLNVYSREFGIQPKAGQWWCHRRAGRRPPRSCTPFL